MFNVNRTFWVQEMMCCPISNIFLKSSSHCLVHPEVGRDEEMIKVKKSGKMCLDILYVPNYRDVGIDLFAIS